MFTSLLFCITTFSCSLTLKENIPCVHSPYFPFKLYRASPQVRKWHWNWTYHHRSSTPCHACHAWKVHALTSSFIEGVRWSIEKVAAEFWVVESTGKKCKICRACSGQIAIIIIFYKNHFSWKEFKKTNYNLVTNELV